MTEDEQTIYLDGLGLYTDMIEAVISWSDTYTPRLKAEDQLSALKAYIYAMKPEGA